MRLRILLLLAFLGSACGMSHAQSQCPFPGTHGTYTSYKGVSITAYCGPSNSVTTACQAGAFGSYASGPITNMPGEPNPCMDVYYLTSAGPTNTFPSFVIMKSGYNASIGNPYGNVNWGDGWNSVTGANGSNDDVVSALVDGTAFTGTALAGTHFNVYILDYSQFAWGMLQTGISSGVNSFSVNCGGTFSGHGAIGHFCPNAVTPNAPNVYMDGENLGPATAISVNLGTFVATVTTTNSTSVSHSTNANVWFSGSAGEGSPSSPCTGQLLQVADGARALSYITSQIGTLPGNGHYVWLGLSGGAETGVKIMMIWKNMLAEPSPCGIASPNTSGTLDAVGVVSPDADAGVVSIEGTGGSGISASQLAPCGNGSTITFNPDPVGYPFTAGPEVGVLGGTASVSTVSTGSTTSTCGLPVTGANALFNFARSVTGSGLSAPQCNGYVAVDSDNFQPAGVVVAGPTDATFICSQQRNFGVATAGFTSTVVAGTGHGADLNVETNCPGGNTSYACVGSASVQAIYAMLIRAYVHGNVSAGGIASGGVTF